MSLDHIAVLGAGAWGSALANLAAQAGHSVTLWARDPAKAAAMQQSRESPRLPGARLHERVEVTGSFADAARADAILLVVPAQALRSVASKLNKLDDTPMIACAKGIERGSLKFMTEVIAEADHALWFCSSTILTSPRAMKPPLRHWRGRSVHRRSGFIIPPTCAAWRLAARRKMSSPLRPGSWLGAGSAPARPLP